MFDTVFFHQLKRFAKVHFVAVRFGFTKVAAHCFLLRLRSSFLLTMNNFLVTEWTKASELTLTEALVKFQRDSWAF